jgi:hypothetical protein
MNAIARHLMTLARDHGQRWYDPVARQCVGPRDTLWFAIALLHAEERAARELGEDLLAEASVCDGTHTPATLLAVLHALSDRLAPPTREHLETVIRATLPEALRCEWHDGNVNHPLAAWATLILAGERFGDATAVTAGLGRLREFARVVGHRRHACRRQAVFSEYNSPTYTALNLWFLALIAAYAQSPEARGLARFLEERLWVETALWYHAPTQQFSGPHSRAYLDDSLGGWSALHCTLAVAVDLPLLLDPRRSLETNHPSAILENALVAIIPFHVPAEARHWLAHKPLPFSLRVQTYGESYHENHAAFGFEDGLYPGGWSQLTSWQTADFALGTAARPYVNAGHADACLARWRRRPEVRGVEDLRSLFCRGVFNEAEVGRANAVHVTGGRTDESYLYEEGRTFTLQHRHRALVAYAPKGVGHRGVRRWGVDVMVTRDAPWDEWRVDGRPLDPDAGWEGPAGSRFTFRDGAVMGVLIPLVPRPAAAGWPVRLRRVAGCLVLAIDNYRGPTRDFDRDELRGWANGFYLELWSTAEFADLDALAAHVAAITVEDEGPGMGRNRRTRVRSGEVALELVHNPWSEEILRATVNGEDQEVSHLEAVDAAGQPLLTARGFYGREAGEGGAG